MAGGTPAHGAGTSDSFWDFLRDLLLVRFAGEDLSTGAVVVEAAVTSGRGLG